MLEQWLRGGSGATKVAWLNGDSGFKGDSESCSGEGVGDGLLELEPNERPDAAPGREPMAMRSRNRWRSASAAASRALRRLEKLKMPNMVEPQ